MNVKGFKDDKVYSLYCSVVFCVCSSLTVKLKRSNMKIKKYTTQDEYFILFVQWNDELMKHVCQLHVQL